jgi:PQQ enzyme repeat
VGVASHNDNPCAHGRLVALDLDTGTVLWTHQTVPDRICDNDTAVACTMTRTAGRARAWTLDPAVPSTVYASYNYYRPGVTKTTDGGGQWSDMSVGLTTSFISALTIDPRNLATLYAGTRDGVCSRPPIAGRSGLRAGVPSRTSKSGC